MMSVPLQALSVHLIFWALTSFVNRLVFAIIVSVTANNVRGLESGDMFCLACSDWVYRFDSNGPRSGW